MTRKELVDQIFFKKTYLAVGLDTDRTKIPEHLRSHPDALFEFNKQIIDATKEHCVAYKINTAFYEAEGVKGWETLEKTVDYIPATHFKIADAKRGDIGNTSDQYAKAFFQKLNFDSITVAPYMGEDSVKAFLQYEEKWAIILGLTSNAGASDFQLKKIIKETTGESEFLYERVLKTASGWGSIENLMFVIGATQASEFINIRRIIPDHFLLVPGVGAQGGSLEEISKKALNRECGLLVNASRAIIYASSGFDYAEKAKEAAEKYHLEMTLCLSSLEVN
ncbi:MAG TPA: orotidine-5'-phosphate decarboxylase [Flavisolibacter sp.]|nr:orotidine-5'-phosphate decarboxylase [Flavisolibacter sp.]